MEQTEDAVVVLDHGSSKIKAGFADSGGPAVIMRSVVGRPKEGVTGSPAGDVCFGDEAISQKDKLHLRFPVEACTTVKWEETEMLWQHVFENKLHADMSEHPLFVSEPPTTPKMNREKTAQMAFETFGVPSFGVAPAASLAVLATCTTTSTGLVVDLGEGPMRVMPVYEGYFVPASFFRCQVDGAHVTQALKKLMCERDPSAQELSWETVKDIKEKLAYVAQDFESELKYCKSFLKGTDSLFPAQQEKVNRVPVSDENFANAANTFGSKRKTYEATTEATPTPSPVKQEIVYRLPSGETITLDKELFQCSEVLFQPKLLGIEMMGVAEHIGYTISNSDEQIQQDLSSNIILTGGGANLTGIRDRVLCDVKQLLHEKGSQLNVNVVSPPHPDTLVWRGGSLCASTPAVATFMMTKEEYDECGPSRIHQKCF